MNDENEWDLALAEASQVQMPPKMRNTFAIILVFGSVTNPLQHWEKYKVWVFVHTTLLKEHFLDRGSMNEKMKEHRALAHIEFILKLHALKLKDVGLPQYDEGELGDDFQVLT